MAYKKQRRGTTSKGSIKKLQDDVKQIYKTVYHGNGKPSVITQLSSIEERIKTQQEHIAMQIDKLDSEMELRIADVLNLVNEKVKNSDKNFDDKINHLQNEMELKFKHITEVVTEKFNNITDLISREFDSRKVHNSGLWNFKTAITTSALASVTSVFILLLSELLKRW